VVRNDVPGKRSERILSDIARDLELEIDGADRGTIRVNVERGAAEAHAHIREHGVVRSGWARDFLCKRQVDWKSWGCVPGTGVISRFSSVGSSM